MHTLQTAESKLDRTYALLDEAGSTSNMESPKKTVEGNGAGTTKAPADKRPNPTITADEFDEIYVRLHEATNLLELLGKDLVKATVLEVPSTLYAIMNIR